MVVLIQLKGHNDFRVPDRNGWRWIQTPWYTNTRAQKVNCHFNSIILVNANKIKKNVCIFSFQNSILDTYITFAPYFTPQIENVLIYY